MNRKLAFSLIYLYPFLCFAQDKSPADTASNALDDVVVQAKYKGTSEEEKLPIQLDFDFSREAVIENRVDWSSIDPKDGTIDSTAFSTLPLKLSVTTAALIRPAPVKSFYTEFEDLQRWQLNITASDGSPFRRLSGEGNPPENLSWDGLGDQGTPLLAGENYAYSFTATDQAGNRRTFPGTSFHIPAFSLQLGDSLLIGLGQQTLFSADGQRLLPGSIDFAREVATLIRLNLNNKKVQVASLTPAGEKFIELVCGELVVPASFCDRIQPPDEHFGGVIFYLVSR